MEEGKAFRFAKRLRRPAQPLTPRNISIEICVMYECES